MNIDGKSIDLAPWVTAGAGVLATAVTGVVTYLISHKKARTDVQGALNQSFQTLVDQLQEEREFYRGIIKEKDDKISKLEKRIEHLEHIVAGKIPPAPLIAT